MLAQRYLGASWPQNQLQGHQLLPAVVLGRAVAPGVVFFGAVLHVWGFDRAVVGHTKHELGLIELDGDLNDHDASLM